MTSPALRPAHYRGQGACSPENFENGHFLLFHSKIYPKGTRKKCVIRGTFLILFLETGAIVLLGPGTGHHVDPLF